MKKFFNDLRSALMFMTILPAGRNAAWSPVGMIRFFPVVGLILGMILVVFDRIVSLFWAPGTVAFLDVLLLVILTGAFHIDGLGDAADGLFSHRSKERVLEIMKDSRSGMMGLVAVFCLLALKTAGIYSMKTTASPAQVSGLLLIIPAYARSSMLAGIRMFDYGRKGTGTGLGFFEKPISAPDFAFVLMPVVISLVLGYKGLVLNLAFILTAAGILMFYKIKLNCITGDMLGAMTETIEAVLFLAAGASWM